MVSRIIKSIFTNNLSSFPIEGGLGSQILSMGRYLYAKSLPEYNFVTPDCKYFTQPRSSLNHPGLQFWSWQLDRYGFELRAFDALSGNSRFATASKKINSQITDVAVFNWMKSNSDLFPIPENGLSELRRRHSIPNQYNVIHIRRGDYVRIGSKIIEHEDYIGLLAKIQPKLKPFTVILSDDELDIQIQKQYLSAVRGKVIFFCDRDMQAGESHDLMRQSRVLITANSTFSYSAAILNDEADLIVSPISHSKTSNSTNIFSNLGKWFIHC